ncbi:zona pellucida-like domain-containing protein 1 [Diretmus argenteus]
MRLVILVCQLGLILRSEAQNPEQCILDVTNRPPENSDINVVCGTKYMEMNIYLCPVYNALYNESLMALNGQFHEPACRGVPDWNSSPPITDQVGTGEFADFSKVQFVNISGVISSLDPSAGTITYRQQILYMFSCRYPMQYLVNNTELAVTGVSLAVRDNNGTFISTLSMQLYNDTLYTTPLIIPATGLNLKTRIFVGVLATNLTDRFHVLLDRCYATTSPLPTNSTFYDLFVGCTRDGQTKVEMNGRSQKAHFSFEAFRFVEHRNLTISTFYLHCITRLCEVSACTSLLPDCSTGTPGPPARRRREAESTSDASSSTATVTSTSISVAQQLSAASFPSTWPNNSMVGVIVTIVILAVLFVIMAIYFGLYVRKRGAAYQ